MKILPSGKRIVSLRSSLFMLFLLIAILMSQACSTPRILLTPEAVNGLLAQGVDVNSYDEDGITLLSKSILDRRPDTVRLLLQKGADPNMPSLDGVSPIIYAAGALETEILRDLLKSGARADYQIPETGETALHIAAITGHTAAIPLLVKAGADINARTFAGNTPLHEAMTLTPTRGLYQILIKHGADISALNHRQQTPLHRLLNQHKDQPLSFQGGVFLVFNVMTHRHIKLPQHLQRQHRMRVAKTMIADLPHRLIDSKQEGGLSHLFLALRYNHIEAAEALLDRKADVTVLTDEKESILLASIVPAARSLRGFSLFEKILEMNPDSVNQADVTGMTPLHMAAYIGATPVINVLLANGADKTLKTIYGYTPLTVAQAQGHSEAAALLE